MSLLSEVKTGLLDLIKKLGEASADEATHHLGLSKTTIRQHLLTLERQGLIEHQSRRMDRGRPQVVYRISEAGARIYPSSDPVLLRELLIFLLKTGHETTVNLFFQHFWENRRKQFESRLAIENDNSLETRTRVLTQILEEEGFMPKIEIASSKRLTIRECNCPFSQAVQATSLPCKLEAEFIQSALGESATRVSYIPNGATACSYEFNFASRAAPSRKKTRQTPERRTRT